MKNSKAIRAALLLTLSMTSATVLHAEPNVAIAAADSTTDMQNRSVEDLVALSKVAESNDALNDAVLGNEALNPNAASDRAVSNKTVVNKPAPLHSTATGVNADKLILNSPVVDQANILNPQEKLRLEAQLQGIYRQGLAQAALVIVPTTGDVPIFDYSLQVAEKWGLGNKNTDDGLLILVAVNDRDMYILTGYGLEGVLPDAALKRIIREEITPNFKQEDYAGGLIKGINRIEERLLADPEVLAQSDALAAERSAQNGSDDLPEPIFLFVMAMIFGNVITSIFGRVLGSFLTAGGFFAGSLALGGGFFMTLIMAVFVWMFLISRRSGGGGGRGGGGGGVVFVPGFGGGSSGGGGFGSGGFGGGGGGFGGGGAGGSW